jgi:ribosomal protein S18 acetylase RimI-like enzyme
MVLTVRRLEPHDHELVRAVRLRALTLAPAAFGSTFDREASFSDDEWRNRLRPDGYPHFVCFDESDQPVGLVVGGPDDVDSDIAHLFAMWVEPHARGTGAADALVEAVVRWADAEGCTSVQLLVTEGNERAERMYRRNGFERSGRSFPRDRDAVEQIEMVRRLT